MTDIPATTARAAAQPAPEPVDIPCADGVLSLIHI